MLIVMRLVALCILLLVAGSSSADYGTHVAGEKENIPSVKFYFYGYRLMLASENQSMLIFDRADFDSPTDREPVIVECVSQIRQTVEGVPVWVGGVAWGSKRLPNDTRMLGTVRFQVWLSSDMWLWPWEFSGVGVGVAEVNENGKVLWGPKYHYQYSIGNMLSSQPKECSVTVDVDHVFKSGNHILFGVVTGSTRQGWRAKAHFGSVGYASCAVASLEGGWPTTAEAEAYDLGASYARKTQDAFGLTQF